MAVREQPATDLPTERWTPSHGEPTRTWGWILQAITGSLLLILVTLHMIANHFVVATGLRDFADVVSYLSNPVIVVIEVLFLIVVTSHGLLGLRAVIFDFGLTPRVERLITRALTALGVVILLYGFWLTWVITSYH